MSAAAAPAVLRQDGKGFLPDQNVRAVVKRVIAQTVELHEKEVQKLTDVVNAKMRTMIVEVYASTAKSLLTRMSAQKPSADADALIKAVAEAEKSTKGCVICEEGGAFNRLVSVLLKEKGGDISFLHDADQEDFSSFIPEQVIVIGHLCSACGVSLATAIFQQLPMSVRRKYYFRSEESDLKTELEALYDVNAF